MQCAPTIVLRAANTVRSGLRQLQDIPDDTAVVVLRDDEPEILYYVFDVPAMRALLASADPDDALPATLRLNEVSPAIARQFGDAAAVQVGNIVLEGQLVVGVVRDDDGVDDVLAVDDGAFDVLAVDDGAFAGAGNAPMFTPHEAASDLPTRDITLRGADPQDGVLGVFRAYPDVAAPAQVVSGHEFTVTAGFAIAPPEHALIAGPPVIVTSGPNPEFIIQIVGFGFTFTEGVERTLRVDRGDPASGRAHFTVIADPAEPAPRRTLEINYEYGGAVVGRTWVVIEILAEGTAPATTTAPIHATGLIGEAPPGQSPHMSLEITTRQGDPNVHWLLRCRYPDIRRPGEVLKPLPRESARSFAVQLMRQVPNAASGGLLDERMQGLGDDVADALPDEFWPMFEQVWHRARDAGDEPRMQITTNEPWVPWELAWIGPERLQPASDLLEPDDAGGAALGQLWQVARWTPPTRNLPTGAIPASPPASIIAADEFAVIVGDYTGTPGVTALPHAILEGKAIAETYGALTVAASDTAVISLMKCLLQREGAQFLPTVVHFAGHGKTDVNNPQFTGLKLMGGALFDSFAVRGLSLLGAQKPFVFLNACEAGASSDTLGRLGGLVGAFLGEGTGGFVAPLWEVNDVEASDIAIEFYRRTLDEGETVGEAMRAIRRRFTAESASATALAYVYYGNPNLRLERDAS